MCDGLATCMTFMIRALKLYPPMLTRLPHCLFFPFDLNSLLPFHSACSQGPFIPSYSLPPFHSPFCNGGQRSRVGLASCCGDKEKVGQASVMISRQAVGSVFLCLWNLHFGLQVTHGGHGNKMGDWCRLVTAGSFGVAREAAVGYPLTEAHPLMRAGSQPLDPLSRSPFFTMKQVRGGWVLFLESGRLLVVKRHNKW